MDSDPPASSEQLITLLTEMVRATVAEKTAAIRLGSRLGSPEVTDQDRRGEGAVDFSTRRAAFRNRLLTPRMAAEGGDGRTRKGPSRWLAQGLTADEEVFIDGRTVYRRLPDGEWIEEASEQQGGRRLIDPLWLLDGLFGTASAEAVGSEKIGDVLTQHYHLVLHRDDAETRLGRSLEWPEMTIRRWWGGSRSNPAGVVRAEIWADGDGRLRRLSFPPVVTDASETTLWATTELTDFGVAVDLRPPAVAQDAETRR